MKFKLGRLRIRIFHVKRWDDGTILFYPISIMRVGPIEKLISVHGVRNG